MHRTVRPACINDIPRITSYFLDAPDGFLRGMGVEISKLPSADKWQRLLEEEMSKPEVEKQLYYVIWEIEGTAVGHSNLNQIRFGERANMHLHLWEASARKQGNGTLFVRESVGRYFETFQLQRLYCEPYAENTAPNRTLRKAGFEFVKSYETTPGIINFHQRVNQWRLSRADWVSLGSSAPLGRDT